MSVCTLLASDHPLPTAAPQQQYPLRICIDDGSVFDGDADDNFYLYPFPDVQTYTGKDYGVWLDWRYTEGRGIQLLDYIRRALCHTEEIQLWHIWLLGWWEYEERPVIHSRTIPFSALTVEDLKKLDDAPMWNSPDRQNPQRPSFYRLVITK